MMGLTFSQTTIKFQKPIMHNSAAVVPAQALVSLMATTYMKCRMNSRVKMHAINRAKYPIVTLHGIPIGLLSYTSSPVRY